MEQQPETKKISDLGVVVYLTLRNILPVDRTVQDGRAILYYDDTAALDEALAQYAIRCAACGVAPIEFYRAQAEGRRMLLQGEMNPRGNERRKR
jgi:hypothetical protein